MASGTGPQLQRARGEVRVGLTRSGDRCRPTMLRQAGSAKAFLHGLDGGHPEVVLLNTAGGLTGGDALTYRVEVGDGVALTATTQTAERAYASVTGTAHLDLAFSVGRGARLDWLPQETILFDRSALVRNTTIKLAEGASVLAVELLAMGRIAMGEQVHTLLLRDRRSILRAGSPVAVEALALDAAALAGRCPARLGDAKAMASVIMLAPGAEDAAAAVRETAAVEGVEAEVSGWDGRLAARLLGRDLWPVKRKLKAMLSVLRGRDLPRVWTAGGV